MRHLRRLLISSVRQRGLTLIELMVALAIGAVLLATGAPFFGDYMSNSRLRENGNLLLTETLIAQSEAIKRNTIVRVSTSGTTIQVLDMTVVATPVVLRERQTTGTITLPTATINFGSEGRLAPFGSADVSIDLSATGVTCSGDLRCPGLRVDAGGAVRLCGNKLSCA
jgi:type IV fimbrial biogenesis protein FimT